MEFLKIQESSFVSGGGGGVVTKRSIRTLSSSRIPFLILLTSPPPTQDQNIKSFSALDLFITTFTRMPRNGNPFASRNYCVCFVYNLYEWNFLYKIIYDLWLFEEFHKLNICIK